MKVNYQLEMEKIIKGISGRPKLLLHSCCAPCSSAVMERLTETFQLLVYYYNPNIEPEEEFLQRAGEQKRLIECGELSDDAMFLCEKYDNDEFRSVIKGLEKEPEGGKRCAACIRLRMKKSAQKALESGCEYFTTTLSVSPHKNAELINTIGKELESEYGVKYLFADFKKKEGYKRSIELSDKYELYRQNYCGCLFAKNNI